MLKRNRCTQAIIYRFIWGAFEFQRLSRTFSTPKAGLSISAILSVLPCNPLITFEAWLASNSCGGWDALEGRMMSGDMRE